jgi:hypothetical protein
VEMIREYCKFHTRQPHKYIARYCFRRGGSKELADNVIKKIDTEKYYSSAVRIHALG